MCKRTKKTLQQGEENLNKSNIHIYNAPEKLKEINVLKKEREIIL